MPPPVRAEAWPAGAAFLGFWPGFLAYPGRVAAHWTWAPKCAARSRPWGRALYVRCRAAPGVVYGSTSLRASALAWPAGIRAARSSVEMSAMSRAIRNTKPG